MRFLIDESIGKAVIEYLRNQSHDVSVVAELTPSAEDSDILACAVREQRIIITNDKDFGDLIFRSGQAHQGVLLFRLRDESAANQVRTLTSVLDQYADRLPGQFAVVRETGIRIRARTLPF